MPPTTDVLRAAAPSIATSQTRIAPGRRNRRQRFDDRELVFSFVGPMKAMSFLP
jgi:hypothetical protein